MTPKTIQVIGSELAVVWDDDHESYYPIEALRRACPCANCAGEPDLFGRIWRGPEPNYSPQSFHLVGIDRIGNYAIQLNWADNHNWGIWTHERLRAFCGCGACGS